MSRIRIATLQYFIRPVKTFEDFLAQTRGLVMTARDYRCRLVVFPEYFTVQLLTLGDVDRPIDVQVRDLARQAPRFVEEMGKLAREAGIYIVAGTIPVLGMDDQFHNDCHVYSPSGEYGVQGKLHMTRFEDEEWRMSPRESLKIFETEFGRMAVTICYDVEFPELARVAALQGAKVLIVPSCTDERQGLLRVRYCAQARAIENQMYVVMSSTVGSLPMVPAVSLNYGQAAILTPSDFTFSRDGIMAEGVANQESMLIGELDLSLIDEGRKNGTVLPLRDAQRPRDVISQMEVISL